MQARLDFPRPFATLASRQIADRPAFPGGAGGTFRYRPQAAASALPTASIDPVAAAHPWRGPAQATALVHDYLAQAGGAERVVAALHSLFPAAPVYTSVYDPNGDVNRVCQSWGGIQPYPSVLRRLAPGSHPLFRPYRRGLEFSLSF